LVNEKSRGAMDSTVSKRAIKKIKPTCFTNDYKRAWFINYSDEILILGHLSNENHNSLWNFVQQVYNRFELSFDTRKTKIIKDTSKPLPFLGFEIMESKKYKFTKLHRQKK